MRVIAIHQPNFLPWLGYFHKMMHCDVFVMLDSVQKQKTGGCWTQRVKFLIGGKAHWMTVPVDRSYHGTRNINEIDIKETEPWRSRMLASIEQSYCKTPYYKAWRPLLEELLTWNDTNLASFNMHGIRRVWSALGLPQREMIASSTCHATGASNELLINLIKELEGTHYLCGGGSAGYQDDALFAAHDLKVIYQNFIHPRYEQRGVTEFVPGLSIFDALFNRGPDAVREMLQAGEREKRD